MKILTDRCMTHGVQYSSKFLERPHSLSYNNPGKAELQFQEDPFTSLLRFLTLHCLNPGKSIRKFLRRLHISYQQTQTKFQLKENLFIDQVEEFSLTYEKFYKRYHFRNQKNNENTDSRQSRIHSTMANSTFTHHHPKLVSQCYTSACLINYPKQRCKIINGPNLLVL